MIWILTMGLNLANVMIVFRFFQCFVRGRDTRIKNYILSYSFALAFLLTACSQLVHNPVFNILVSFLAVMAVSVFFWGSHARMVMLSCGYLCIQVFVDVAVVLGIDLVLGKNTQYYVTIPSGIITVFESTIVVYVSYILVTILFRTRKNGIQPYQNKLYYQMIVVPILCIFIIFAVLSDQIHGGKINYLLTYTILTALIIINLFQYVIFERLEILYREHLEQNTEIEKFQHREIYYNQLEQHQEEIRRIRHNMKNQLMSLDFALAGNDSEAVRKEIAGVITDIEQAESICYTKNSGINTMLNVKCQEMHKKHIETTIEVNSPGNLKISNVDIGVVIGNILDNAMEACEKCPKNTRFIHFIAHYHKSVLVISCKNSTVGKVNGTRTSKKDKINHGYGLKSISIIARKYNGAVDYSIEDGFFQVDVNLWDIDTEDRVKVAK